MDPDLSKIVWRNGTSSHTRGVNLEYGIQLVMLGLPYGIRQETLKIQLLAAGYNDEQASMCINSGILRRSMEM